MSAIFVHLCSTCKSRPLQKLYTNSTVNVVTQLKYANGIMFDFYLVLPHLHTKEVTDFAVIHDCKGANSVAW